MVFHRLLPLDLVDELIGGYLRASWMRLEPYVARRRITLGPTFAEWFQWLAERTAELPSGGAGRGAPGSSSLATQREACCDDMLGTALHVRAHARRRLRCPVRAPSRAEFRSHRLRRGRWWRRR